MKHALKAALLMSLLSSISIASAQTVTATSGSTSSSVSDANSTATGNAQGTNTGTNTNTINFPDGPSDTKSTVEYKGSYTMKAAPTVYAPPLVTTMTDTCMGSSSLGASFSGFGLSGGTTWTDKNCVSRLDAREFRAMGMNDVAIALLCQNPDNQAAVEATGRTCPSKPVPVAAPVVTSNDAITPPAAPAVEHATAPLVASNDVIAPPAAPAAEPAAPIVANTISDNERYTDPIIRKRLGLEPLK